MLSTAEQEAGLLLRCKPSDGHKTTYGARGGGRERNRLICLVLTDVEK